jgi:hypothetical protein
VDDAIGEAYDKVARMLGLELTPSGGPALEVFAQQGDPLAYKFTVPFASKITCDFSYSGLKTAVCLALEKDVGADLGPASLQVPLFPAPEAHRPELNVRFHGPGLRIVILAVSRVM